MKKPDIPALPGKVEFWYFSATRDFVYLMLQATFITVYNSLNSKQTLLLTSEPGGGYVVKPIILGNAKS